MSDEFGVTSATPVLIVEAIEPCLAFWRSVGFIAVLTVPDAAPHDFAILQCAGVELMLQTRASAEKDVPAVADAVRSSVVYVSVASLAPVLDALGEAERVVERRTTFYGADEVFVRDPAGNIIGFAAPAQR